VNWPCWVLKCPPGFLLTVWDPGTDFPCVGATCVPFVAKLHISTFSRSAPFCFCFSPKMRPKQPDPVLPGDLSTSGQHHHLQAQPPTHLGAWTRRCSRRSLERGRGGSCGEQAVQEGSASPAGARSVGLVSPHPWHCQQGVEHVFPLENRVVLFEMLGSAWSPEGTTQPSVTVGSWAGEVPVVHRAESRRVGLQLWLCHLCANCKVHYSNCVLIRHRPLPTSPLNPRVPCGPRLLTPHGPPATRAVPRSVGSGGPSC
jgi:hypothetical protein